MALPPQEQETRVGRKLFALVALAGSLLLAACEESGDYLAVSGGGFLFNYRLAEATYSIVLRPLRTIPEGSVDRGDAREPCGR